MLIAAEKLSKQYNDTPLIKDASLFIHEGDKIGVIGRNGTGKTTLLKMIAQQEQPDSGAVTVHSSIQVGYLPQVPLLTEQHTVLDEVLHRAAAAGKDAEAFEAKHILHKLGILDLDAKIETLSGGQRKRVALASALITRCELLILDEPTNHLDDAMIHWLEEYLIQYKGALLMVTHDRYFLDRIVSKIIEVSSANLYTYDSNYSKYLELRAEREAMELGTERKRQSLLRKELAWMRQGPQGRGTKSRSRIERFEQLEQEVGPQEQAKLSLESISTRLGKKTIELHGLTKGYGGRVLIQDFEQIIVRDARIGIVGPNGCGKSTLLKLIAGQIQPDSGKVIVGDTVSMGYFAQECTDMDDAMRVIDYVKSHGETLQSPSGPVSASQMLERFLFPPDLQWNTISRLSGGERRRLYLLSILMQAPNILLLDEPTNDLDIDTLMVLEDYIESFSGAVVLVSHDRYFLDKTTDHILEFQGDGVIRKYLGGYSDYLNSRATSPAAKPSKEAKADSTRADKRRAANAPSRPRFSFKEQREYEEIDAVLAGLETQKQEVEQALEASASDYEAVQRLMEAQADITRQLEEKTERWFYLQDLAEQIEQYATAEYRKPP